MKKDVEYEGLRLKIIPKRTAIVRTNEITMFELSITNISDKEHRGKILIQWLSPFGSHMIKAGEVIKLDPPLQPNETKSYPLEYDNVVEGTVIGQVAKIGPPESLELLDDIGLTNRPVADGDVLYSYRVIDEATYLEEQRKHKEVLEKIDTMKDTIATTVLNQLKKEIYKPDFVENLRSEYQRLAITKEAESKKPQLEQYK